MSYADSLQYLNKCLAFLRSREEQEKQMLEEAGGAQLVNSTPDWDVAVTEWRIQNQCHELTRARAKRFIKEWMAAQTSHSRER